MASATATPALIEDQVLYRADEFCRRMGWGRKAFDAARRRGLKTHRSSKRLYVNGTDGREFIERDSANNERLARNAAENQA